MRQLEFPKISALLDWTKQKICSHHSERVVYFSEQEIWWTSIGENIRSEENGKNHNFERPVLILKKFNKDLFWGLPISTTIKEERWYYTFKFNGEPRSLMLTQIRALSSCRLLRRIDRMSEQDFAIVQRRMQELLLDKKANPPAIARGFSDPLSRTL